MAEKTVSVILTGQNDWDEWIEVVKTKAIAFDIWSLVNPDTTNPPTLEEPQAPKPRSVNPQKTIFSELDEDEKEQLRELQRERKRNLDKYDRRRQALASLRAHIQGTVARTNLSYTFNCETVHDMLVKLQKRFSPTDEAREREVIRRYQNLRTEVPKTRAKEPWLQEWEKAYDDCKRLKLPDTEGNRAARDFIYTVDTFDPVFASYWRNRLLESNIKLDFHEIVQKFREYQTESPENSRNHHSAFETTFQGKGIHGDDKKKLKECLCGEIHHFKDCPYLIEEKRSPGWNPDPQLEQKINERLHVNEKLRGIIERLRKETKTTTDKNTEMIESPAVF